MREKPSSTDQRNEAREPIDIGQQPSTPAGKDRGTDGADCESELKSITLSPRLLTELLGGAALVGFGLSAYQGSLLGQIVAVLVGLSGLRGLWRGGFRKLVMLPIKLAMIVVLASKPDFADPVIQLIVGKSSAFFNVVACVLVYIIGVVMASMVTKAFREQFVASRPRLKAGDHLLGMGFGLAEGGILVLALCWTTVLLEPQAKRALHRAVPGQQLMMVNFVEGIVRLGKEIDESPLEPIARGANLLEKVPGVKEALAKGR